MSLGLTVMYRVRLSYYSFINFKLGGASGLLCDQDYFMVTPIINLTFIALLSGPSLMWIIFGFPSLVFLPGIIKIGAIFVIRVSGFLAVIVCTGSINLIHSSIIKIFNGAI